MEESKARAGAAGGAAQESGLGFGAALFMGKDRLGDVWVRPQPFPRSPSASPSPSPPQSSSLPQPQLQLQRQRPQQQQLQQQQHIKVKDDGENEEERDRKRAEQARIAFGSEIRVASLSPPSERCPPLSVLHTISPDGVWFQLNHPPDDKSQSQKLSKLHQTCITEAKTAVVLIEGTSTEVHLVAIRGGDGDQGCQFWAFAVPAGLYQTSLAMLDARRLAIVFDLDETLILANTMRSFEDRIESFRLQLEKLRVPVPDKAVDTQKLASLSAELKRFQQDRAVLKHYIDNDCVTDDTGRVHRAQSEEVAPNVFRPVVRFPDRNLILTRINPAVRDTSVLVKLRPGWEELRSTILAKERKRFEVFICTMSERDYALEMWRLLDPEGRLIDTKDLQKRLLCVKPDSQKSLSNMFEQHRVHPKLAMVIDDRTDVWEDRDKPHVHWVPPYAPYSAPEAEINLFVMNGVRTLVMNVRNTFYKDFDELLQGKLCQVRSDTDVLSLPCIPSVAKYLIQESSRLSGKTTTTTTGPPDGIAGAEVKSALNPAEPSAGGWIEAEDEEQGPPESPSAGAGAGVVAAVAPSVSNPQSNGSGSEKHVNGVEAVNGGMKPPESNTQRYAQDAKKLVLQSTDYLSALDQLAKNFNVPVEFRCAMREQFSAEAFFDGKRAGQGAGQSNKEAKSRAAEDALRYLANMSGERVGSNTVEPKQRAPPSFSAVAALKDMCDAENWELDYMEHRFKGGFESEVEVKGQIMGRGSGADLDSAKHQAAEQALKKLLSGTGNKPQKRSSPPQVSRQESSKRFKSGGENWRPSNRNRVRTPPRKYSRSRR